jgi:MinD-like ATPase involved in chromosome partitioning or flagellar assembly
MTMDRKHIASGQEPRRPRLRLVGIHSMRGGCGKTTVAANLAYLAARAGSRVAVLDADLQAPSLHFALGVDTQRVLHSVSEFVQGRCELGEVPIDLTRELGLEGRGSCRFLPASTDMQTVVSILLEGYDVARFNRCVLRLAQELDLDYLIIDTHFGFNRETLLSLAIADTLLVLLRGDDQDLLASARLLQMARRLGVPSCAVVPNMVEEGADRAELAAAVEKALGEPVAHVLPWCGGLRAAKGRRLLALARPEHPLASGLERICQQLLPAGVAEGVA